MVTNSSHETQEGQSPPATSLTPCLVILVVIAAVVVLAIVALTTWARSNRIPAMTEATLTSAEKRWAEQRLADYRLRLRLGGDRPGEVDLEVVGGEVQKMARDGRTPTQQRTWRVWSVDGQFDMLWRELQIAADPVREMNAPPGTQVMLRAEFDPQWGLPRRFHRAVQGRGPEVYWEVIEFQPR